MVIISGCLMLGLVTLSVGSGLMTDLIGQIAAAFGTAVTRLVSQAPATAPPPARATGRQSAVRTTSAVHGSDVSRASHVPTK